MRSDWTITITNYRGARQYRLTAATRKTIKIGLASSMVVAALVLTGLISQSISKHDLQQQMVAMQENHGELQRQNEFLVAERGDLIATIEQRSRRLANLETDIMHLEGLLAVDTDEQAPLELRVSNAYDEVFEKQLMLRNIPRLSPVPFNAITSSYGMRKHPLKGSRGMHHGVDLRADMRTPVIATADGIVVRAGRYSNGIGKMVEIQHQYGFSTVYGHLDGFEVKVGDIVSQGDVIAKSGNTGLSTAPHLHYEVHYLNERVDPQPFLQWQLRQFDNLVTRQQDIPWASLEKAIATTVKQRLHQRDRPTLATQPSSQPTARLTAASP